MTGYTPINPNANDAFGFTDPSGSPQTTQPDWRWILVGGVLVVVFVYLYQRRKVNELKSVIFQVNSDKNEL